MRSARPSAPRAAQTDALGALARPLPGCGTLYIRRNGLLALTAQRVSESAASTHAPRWQVARRAQYGRFRDALVAVEHARRGEAAEPRRLRSECGCTRRLHEAAPRRQAWADGKQAVQKRPGL